MSDADDRRQKARLLVQEIGMIEEQNQSLRSETQRLEEILSKLDQKIRVPLEEIRKMGIDNVSEEAYSSALTQTRLRAKVFALISKKNSELEENNRLAQEKNELLRSLSICYRCNGKGMTVKPQYHREEEGVIQVGEETSVCSFCNGTGKVPI